MRITLRLDEQLLSEARQAATRRGKSLTAVIEDALRESLARQRGGGPRELVRLPSVGGSGLMPGVDLDSSETLLDVMEAADDPR